MPRITTKNLLIGTGFVGCLSFLAFLLSEYLEDFGFPGILRILTIIFKINFLFAFIVFTGILILRE